MFVTGWRCDVDQVDGPAEWRYCSLQFPRTLGKWWSFRQRCSALDLWVITVLRHRWLRRQTLDCTKPCSWGNSSHVNTGPRAARLFQSELRTPPDGKRNIFCWFYLLVCPGCLRSCSIFSSCFMFIFICKSCCCWACIRVSFLSFFFILFYFTCGPKPLSLG